MKKLIIITAVLLSGYAVEVSAQLNMTLLGTLPYAQDLNDIWGYVDTSGNEYALVGVFDKVSVVDISNPANPTEVFGAIGAGSTWRDIKTWNNHAYITNESSGGLMIIDLSSLPSNPNLTVGSYTGGGLNSAHNLFIDENGYAYIFGSNLGGGGAVILDLNIDPMAPVQVGIFTNFYIHDGMARGDTLWASHVYDGFFSAIDVSNKANPVIFNAGAATHTTPNNFTHNCWISDNNNTLFTTDEQSGAFLTSYDVSDLSNMTELDRVRSNPGSGVIPHNTHFINDYIVTSYYRDGVTIHDVSRPANMIQVGNYDTYTQGSGNGFNGAWGTYPWLPSGNVIVADIENGLFVLGATYIRACYLEGTVTDFSTSNPINNATIEILTTPVTSNSNISGNYATGIITAGTYNVAFSAAGYISDTLSAILSNGVLTVLNAQLLSLNSFTVTGQVVKSGSGNPVANANVLIENSDFQFALTADAGGNFSIPTFFQGNYEVIAGKWNYITNCFNQVIDTASNSLLIELDSGIYDDFTFNFGWTITGTAATGIWERGKPIGTDYNTTGDANPGVDVSTDCSDFAYVTGNGGGSAGTDDVDDGNTVLTSPVFDLSSYANPYISYYRWFFNDGGFGTPDDTLKVSLTNGTTTILLETVTATSLNNSSWVFRFFKISDYITPTATMKLMFETSDLSGSGHLVEAGADKFRITDNGVPPVADFTSSVDSICTGDTVQFIDNSLIADTYQWIFQGGVPPTDTSQNPIAVYNTAGIYDVTLIVSNTFGIYTFTDTLIQTALINVYGTPAAMFSTNVDTVYLSPTGDIQFTDNSVNASSYYWDFGDGQNSTLQNPVNTYTTQGAYTVTLTVSNPVCGDDTISKTVYAVAVIGVDETSAYENNFINAFPNPSGGSVLIEYKLPNNISTGAKMLIVDLLGRTVIEIALTSKQGAVIIDDDEISEGIYFVRIVNDKNFSRTVKLVKF